MRECPLPQIVLPPHLERIREKLAENIHELWALTRIEQGWTYGPVRGLLLWGGGLGWLWGECKPLTSGEGPVVGKRDLRTPGGPWVSGGRTRGGKSGVTVWGCWGREGDPRSDSGVSQVRDDNKRLHPCLVDFHSLPEPERNYNLQMSGETLK